MINNKFANSILSKNIMNKVGGLELPELSDKAFEVWRSFIYDKCGIYFQDNKKYLLESRLQKRMKFLKMSKYEDYFDYVKFNVNGAGELKYLYEAITINETFFFRNQPQIDALVSKIVPEIYKNRSATSKYKLRIWSAASSSGEEAYTISMAYHELLKPKYPGLEIEIIGTDINFAVIETAKKGIFKEYSVRNTPSYYLKKYFTQQNGVYILNPIVKRNVSFKILNLYDNAQMRMMNNFDVIFCANVLIYFDLKSKIKVVSHLYNGLVKGGYLFIGYSETLHGISKAFKVISFPKTIGYKKE